MFRLLGGKLRVSLLMLPAAVVMLLTNSLTVILGFAAAAVIHECAHAAMACALNVRLTRVEILPYGCSAIIEGLGELKPMTECMIALAGPLSNLLCYALAKDVSGALAGAFTNGCVSLAVINLLPCAKTDGGRILRAALSGKVRETTIGTALTVLSSIIFAALTAAFIVLCTRGEVNLSLMIIALFVLISTVNENRRNRLLRTDRLALRSSVLKRGDAAVVCHAVTPECTARKALSLMEINRYNVFCIIDKDMSIRANIDEGEVISRAIKEGTGAKISARHTFTQPAQR